MKENFGKEKLQTKRQQKTEKEIRQIGERRNKNTKIYRKNIMREMKKEMKKRRRGEESKNQEENITEEGNFERIN